MMALRGALRLLGLSAAQPTGLAASETFATAAVATSSNSALRAFASDSSGPKHGRTASEMGDDAAHKLGGNAEPRAEHAGEGVEGRVQDAGFVPSADAVLSPDTAGRAGGPGVRAMQDVADMIGGSFSGDKQRAARAAQDLTHQSDTSVSPNTKPPHTTSQDWPRGGLSQGSNKEATHTYDKGIAAGTRTGDDTTADRYEGTIPSSSPPKSPPEVDQDPPENTTAGPSPGYTTRGGDQRAI